MTTQQDPASNHSAQEGRSATPLVVAMVLIAVAVVVYFALGMPGMDHTAPSNSHEMSARTRHRLVDRATFEVVAADPAVVTVNVHVPATDIHLDGTDLAMPFDDLDITRLPSDRSVPLALYCRSGEMSAIAARRLLDLGYTDVTELDGGIEAGAGRPSS